MGSPRNFMVCSSEVVKQFYQHKSLKAGVIALVFCGHIHCMHPFLKLELNYEILYTMKNDS